MQLVAWIGVCVLAAVLLRNRLLVAIILVLLLWAAIPGVASSLITGVARGNALAFHPATWLIVLTFIVALLHRFHAMMAELARHIFVYLALGVFLCAAFLASRTSPSGGGLVLFLSQMVGPVLLFWLVCMALNEQPDGLLVIRNWLLGIAAVQSVIALIQWSIGGVFLYHSYYLLNYWFDEINFPRWMGTLDHPLTLSLLLCVTVPLLAGLRSVWLQLPLMLLMVAGTMATQSRVGLAVVALGVVYVLLSSTMRPGVKVVSMVVVVAVAWWAASTQLSAGLAQRLTNDGGSAGAREAALSFFFDNIPRFLLAGGGIGSASGFADAGGLTTSLESSILIYAVDVGVLFAVIYFGTALILVVRSFGPSTCRGLFFAGLVVVIVPQTFNALNAQTLAGPLMWLILGMCTSMADHRRMAAVLPPPSPRGPLRDPSRLPGARPTPSAGRFAVRSVGRSAE